MTNDYISIHIDGVPYPKKKSRGAIDAPKQWAKKVREATCHLPKVKKACILKITFLLPPDKFPKDCPFGSDLDNLLKPFFDALNETVFSDAPGKDSCVLSLNVMKTRVETPNLPGAHLEILPIELAAQ